MHTAIVVNKDSRRAEMLASAVIRRSSSLRAKKTDVYLVKAQNLITALAEVKRRNPHTVVIAGGDGTVNAAINTFAQSNICLGIIPLGTTNNFARSLRVPLDPREAMKVIQRWQSRHIHLGKVNDTYFANLATIGLSVDTAQAVESRAKKLFGRLAYPLYGTRLLFRHQPFRCEISTKVKEYGLTTHQLLVANGSYHGALPIAPTASVSEDRLLCIVLGVDRSLWRHMRSLLAFGTGRQHYNRDTLIFEADEIAVATHPSQRVEADGEIISATPAVFSINKNALRVYCL